MKTLKPRDLAYADAMLHRLQGQAAVLEGLEDYPAMWEPFLGYVITELMELGVSFRGDGFEGLALRARNLVKNLHEAQERLTAGDFRQVVDEEDERETAQEIFERLARTMSLQADLWYRVYSAHGTAQILELGRGTPADSPHLQAEADDGKKVTHE